MTGLKSHGGIVRRCKVCGCTDDDCRQCIEKTGEPCWWVSDDLCSACVQRPSQPSSPRTLKIKRPPANDPARDRTPKRRAA